MWPLHFPTSCCCPPEDARKINDEVFFLVRQDPPLADDFQSASEKGLHPMGEQCERAALSTGIQLDYIIDLRKVIPSFRHRLISCARLEESHGRIKQTGKPGHHSLWLTAEALLSAPTIFKVLS